MSVAETQKSTDNNVYSIKEEIFGMVDQELVASGFYSMIDRYFWYELSRSSETNPLFLMRSYDVKAEDSNQKHRIVKIGEHRILRREDVYAPTQTVVKRLEVKTGAGKYKVAVEFLTPAVETSSVIVDEEDFLMRRLVQKLFPHSPQTIPMLAADYGQDQYPVSSPFAYQGVSLGVDRSKHDIQLVIGPHREAPVGKK